MDFRSLFSLLFTNNAAQEQKSALHDLLTILRIVWLARSAHLVTMLQTARAVVDDSQGMPPSARGRTARSGCGDQKSVCDGIYIYREEGEGEQYAPSTLP